MRSPTEADIPMIVRLVNEYAPEPLAESAVRQEWDSPRADVELNARMEEDAYVMVESIDRGRVWMSLHGRPSRELLDWAEARSEELGSRLLSGAWSDNTPVLGALQSRRFGLVRHSHRMLIDLAEPTADPDCPAGIAVRTFEPGDERTFYEIHQETFRDMWEPIEESFDEWAHWLLTPPAFVPELWFLAHAGDEPAGIAICHPHRSRSDHGWIRILGVRQPWRRRGLGRALLLQAFAEFRKRGLAAAALGVDAESDTGAHRLYERVGMHMAARFDILEKSAR